MKRILIIDNAAQEKTLVNEALKREGYRVNTLEAESLDLVRLDPATFDLAIVNLYPDVSNTWGIYLDFKQHFPDTPVLVYMSHHALDSLKAAINNIFKIHQTSHADDRRDPGLVKTI